MKKIGLFLILLMVLAGCTTSKRMYFATTPESVDSLNVNLYEEKYGEYDAVYLNYDKTFEHYGTADYSGYHFAAKWGYVIAASKSILILNPDNDDYTTLSFSVSNSFTLENVVMSIKRPNRTTEFFNINDFIIEENSDKIKKYKFVFPDVSKGSIIQYSYEQHLKYAEYLGSNFLEDEFWLQNSIPCEHFTFKFAFPDWWELRLKDLGLGNPLDYTRSEDIENKKVTYKYEQFDIPGYKKEIFSPFYKEWLDYFEYNFEKLDMSFSHYKGPQDWSKCADNYDKYAMGKNAIFSRKVQTTADDLTQNLSTEYEKLDAIVDYIHENVKLQKDKKNRNYAKILKDGEGDPFRICGLTQAMLKKAEIHSDVIMIHSAQDGYFDEDYISYSQFSIPAVKAIIGDEDYYIFPYLKFLEINHMPDYVGGEKALIIPQFNWEEWSKKTAEIFNLPYGKMDDNTIIENYNLVIGEDGIIKVQEEKIFSGELAYSAREALDEANAEESDDFIDELLTYTDGDIDYISYEIENKDEYKLPLIITLSYEIDNLVMVTPEEIVFQTGGLFSALSSKKYKIETDNRTSPIKIYFDKKSVKNISINFPENWELNSDFEDSNYMNKFGSIERKFEFKDSSFKANQELILMRSYGEKEEAEELYKLLGKKSKLKLNSINFNVKL